MVLRVLVLRVLFLILLKRLFVVPVLGRLVALGLTGVGGGTRVNSLGEGVLGVSGLGVGTNSSNSGVPGSEPTDDDGLPPRSLRLVLRVLVLRFLVLRVLFLRVLLHRDIL